MRKQKKPKPTMQEMQAMMEAIQNMRVAVGDHTQFHIAPPSVN